MGIATDSDLEAIRAAYRKLVLVHHPDRSKAADAKERFIEIVQAYEVLSDPARRSSYDRLLEMERHERPRPKPPSAPPTREPHARPNAARTVARPNQADLHRLAGLFGRGQLLEAERFAKQMLEREPRLAPPYAVLGDIAKFRGEVKKAAEMYAYALQMDPGNTVYERKHEEMLRSLDQIGRHRERQQEGRGAAAGGVGMAVVIAAASYIAVSREDPIFTSLAPVSTWTLGLVAMLFLCGVAAGATLALAGLVNTFAGFGSSATTRISPPVLLAAVAIVNFWAATALYMVVGATQDAFNESTSRFLAGVAGVTAVLALAASATQAIDSAQVALWGGNVVYLGAVVGWMVADGIRQ